MKFKEMVMNEFFWFTVMWFCGFLVGLSTTMVPGKWATTERQDAQISQCLTVAQKWCPTDEKREERFDWCMKQWK